MILKLFWLYLVREFYIAQVVLIDIWMMVVGGFSHESDD